MAAMLAACGSDDSETLIMGTSADYPPYESFDTATGEIIGFDVDIAQHITEELGYELQIEDMDFTSLIPALESGRIDFVLSGMTPDDERRESADFSDIYYYDVNLIVTAEDSQIGTMDDLQGKIVAVQLGSIQEQKADTIAEEYEFEVVKLNRIPEIVQELLAGRIDAILMEDKVAEGFLSTQEELVSFEVPAEEGEELGSAIAFPKGSDLVEPFNEKLNDMMDEGIMDELILKWFDAESE